jgi:hypothetical protein
MGQSMDLLQPNLPLCRIFLAVQIHTVAHHLLESANRHAALESLEVSGFVDVNG